jgi:hypothetical protein
MDIKDNNDANNTQLAFMSWGIYAVLFFMGITFSNIIHFYLEDKFQQQNIYSLLFGGEYAKSLSWFLCLSCTFLALFGMRTYFTRKFALFHLSHVQSITLKTMLFLSFVSFFIFCVHTLYNYLNGYSTMYGLLRIAVTVCFIAMLSVFSYLELKKYNWVNTWSYLSIIGGIVVTMNIYAVFLTSIYASPTLLRNNKLDFEIYESLQHISKRVTAYYAKQGTLPKNFEELTLTGYLKINDLKSREVLNAYTKKSDTTYQLCADFKTSSTDNPRKL